MQKVLCAPRENTAIIKIQYLFFTHHQRLWVKEMDRDFDSFLGAEVSSPFVNFLFIAQCALTFRVSIFKKKEEESIFSFFHISDESLWFCGKILIF